ncbi:MarR family winged helix-turn-helix transcriptional regulator [Nitratireductor pacificus]|uniref:MarR family winged helix-turn-helix transcriptional regulator n=1 Tax=Nitratireductor pacificus TaxID=1231180 RepID=UPI0002E9A45A|nr:MarR family winged helix-turn-helix transcriptional regulator [Nitratireductor pacificus]
MPFIKSEADYRRFRRMLFDLLVLDSNMTSMFELLARHLGLSRSQHMVIMTIANEQGELGVAVQTVADYLQVASPFITAQCNALHDRELITRDRDPNDRRRTLLRLTPTGEAYARRAGEIARELNNSIFAPMDDASFETVARSLDDLSRSSRRALHLARAELEASHAE